MQVEVCKGIDMQPCDNLYISCIITDTIILQISHLLVERAMHYHA